MCAQVIKIYACRFLRASYCRTFVRMRGHNDVVDEVDAFTWWNLLILIFHLISGPPQTRQSAFQTEYYAFVDAIEAHATCERIFALEKSAANAVGFEPAVWLSA